MNKDDKNEYSLSLIEKNIQKILGIESLEEMIRPIYYKEVVQCTNILDIEYPITALSILGRTLDKITREYCSMVISDIDMFQLSEGILTYEELAELFWKDNSNIENRINLMVGKEVEICGVKGKLKSKIITTVDYSNINTINLIRLDHINGETEFATNDNYNYDVCKDNIIDLENTAKNYIESGIKTLVKLEVYLKELYKNMQTKENYLDKFNVERNSLDNVKNGIVILECEKTLKQGTAFFIENIGFITCAHVIGENTHAFKENDVTNKYPVKLIQKIEAIDLAIIEIPGLKEIKSFKIKTQSKLKIMDEIYVAGYPNYRVGDECRIVKSMIAAKRPVSGIQRLLLDKAIITGNSGGPALDLDCEHVVGIAVTGDEDISKASITENNAIIPIDAINHVISRI